MSGTDVQSLPKAVQMTRRVVSSQGLSGVPAPNAFRDMLAGISSPSEAYPFNACLG